jgi:hypothetical protein
MQPAVRQILRGTIRDQGAPRGTPIGGVEINRTFLRQSAHAAMDRAAARRVADQARRTGVERTYGGDAAALLDNFANERKSYVTSQYVTERIRYERANSPRLDQATVTEAALNELESCWNDRASKLQVIPGKEALSMFNQYLQNEYGVSVTPTTIVDAMRVDEIPNEMRTLMEDIAGFARSNATTINLKPR